MEPAERRDNIGMLRFEARDHFQKKAPILIADKCFHISAVERQVAKAVKTHGVQLVAVDYAQLLKGDGDQKYLQVGDVSTRCKNLCTRFNIIILLLVQLGREFERRTDDGPKLSDLQHSSQLEQDADQVWALFWPAKTDKEYPDKEEFRVYFLKNRHRPIKEQGVIKMTVNAPRQRITGFVPYDGGFR
jgi:replicative DNA helicase